MRRLARRLLSLLTLVLRLLRPTFFLRLDVCFQLLNSVLELALKLSHIFRGEILVFLEKFQAPRALRSTFVSISLAQLDDTEFVADFLNPLETL